MRWTQRDMRSWLSPFDDYTLLSSLRILLRVDPPPSLGYGLQGLLIYLLGDIHCLNLPQIQSIQVL